MLRENPSLPSEMGQNFGCFDMAGLKYSQESSDYYVEVMDRATLFIEVTSSEQIIAEQNSGFIELKAQFCRQMRVLHAVVRDSLSLNVDPQIINTFLLDEESFLTKAVFFPFSSPAAHSQFAVRLYVPQANVAADKFRHNQMDLTITRHDIGTIMGSVLSWVSILVLLCGLLVFPLMKYSLILVQAESLFQIEP